MNRETMLLFNSYPGGRVGDEESEDYTEGRIDTTR